MNVLAFSAFYLPGYKGGGPIKTVKNLFACTGHEICFKLITSDRDLGGTCSYSAVTVGAWNDVGNASVFYMPPGFSGLLQVVSILHEKSYDVVYLNSFFSFRFSFFPLLISKLLRQKVILGPRGEFSKGALSLKSLRKRLFILIYKLLRLHRGTIFQASTDFEALDIRSALGCSVDIQIAEDIGSQDFADKIISRDSGALKVVFVSRISPKKNLLAALEILRSVKKPVNYHIYGPIEDLGYWAKCKAAVAALPPHVQVQYRGELSPDEVVKTISKYDLFFMPTKGENYGHVIAEALCAGLPILISDATPWRKLKEQGLGWDLPLSAPAAFTMIIDELATMPVHQHLRMREAVLAWAKKKFTQQNAVEASIFMFRYACACK